MDSRPTISPSKTKKVNSTKQYCHWKLGTINVLTASDDLLLYECMRQCTRAGLDICCFQEFRRLGNDSLSLSVTLDDKTTDWNIWWSGLKKQRRAGVGIAIRSNKNIVMEDIGYVSSRLIWIDCICYGMKLRIICAYAPTEIDSQDQKDKFYKDLNQNCVIEKKRQLIICGDMNATAEYCKSFVGGKKCTYSNANNNGERFANFLISNELALSNTWYEHKKIHKDTWYSNTGKFSKTIDYISLNKWIMQYSIDCRVRTSFVFNNSDHRLLVCRFKTPRRRIDRKRFVKKKQKTKRYDISGLKDEYIKSNFVNKVDQLCNMIESKSIGIKDCEKLVNILEKAAESTLQNIVKTVEAKLRDNDSELTRLNTLRDLTDRNTHPSEFTSISKQIRRRFNQIRNLYYSGEAEKLDEAYEARNLEKLFRLSKKSSSNKKPAEQPCAGLKEHFETHFTHLDPSEEPPDEITRPPEFIKRLTASGVASDADLDQINSLTIYPPDASEIKSNIKKLKDKRASTDVPAEFLKAALASASYISSIESMYREVWEDVVIPELWRKTTITALYKNKGKRKECKNYRGLSIGSTFLKLAMSIILERLRPWYNRQLLPNQNGFRQYLGCPDAIFALKSIHNISSRMNKEIFVLFVDLTAAYDWCVRKWLFHTIFNRVDPINADIINCIRIMEELYRKTQSVMKGEDSYFETTSGVRQGGPESPNLFNLYLDYIMRIYNNRAEELGLGISFMFRVKDQARRRGDHVAYKGSAHYPWFGYADDLALTAVSKDHLQTAANILCDLLQKFGLVISIDKTKTMILNFKGNDYPSSIININSQPIENVTHFTYLGAVISYSEPGTSEKELDRRIGLAHSKFSELKKLLCNYNLKLNIRVKFYDVYVRSRLCYCCETWTLTQKQYNRIEAVHFQFLRRIIRGGMAKKSSNKEIADAKLKSKKGGDQTALESVNWAWKLNNDKIITISKTSKIVDYIEKQNIRWVAHVIRSSNDTLAKQLMFVDEKFCKVGFHHQTVYENVIKIQKDQGKSVETFLRECLRK